MRAIGVDFSKYQSKDDNWSGPHGIDFPKMHEKADFLIGRAGYAGSAGGAWVDERVHQYMDDLERILLDSPLPFTFYWFSVMI